MLCMKKKGFAWNQLASWLVVITIVVVLLIMFAGASGKLDLGVLQKIS